MCSIAKTTETYGTHPVRGKENVAFAPRLLLKDVTKRPKREAKRYSRIQTHTFWEPITDACYGLRALRSRYLPTSLVNARDAAGRRCKRHASNDDADRSREYLARFDFWRKIIEAA